MVASLASLVSTVAYLGLSAPLLHQVAFERRERAGDWIYPILLLLVGACEAAASALTVRAARRLLGASAGCCCCAGRRDEFALLPAGKGTEEGKGTQEGSAGAQEMEEAKTPGVI